jgi:hypothetical protein
MVNCAAAPGSTLCDPAGAATLKSDVVVLVPVPLSEAVCGDPAALSATLTVAVKAEPESGVKVTETVQFVPAASVVPQLVVSAKSAGLAPARVMPEMVSAALPVLERVSVCGAVVLPTLVVAKVSVEGVSEAIGAGTAVPVPVRVTTRGEPAALLATLSVAA